MAKVWFFFFCPEKHTRPKETLLLFIWLTVYVHHYHFWLSNYAAIIKTGMAGSCCHPWRVRTWSFPRNSSRGSSTIVQAWLSAGENLQCCLLVVHYTVENQWIASFFPPQTLAWVSVMRLVQVMPSVNFTFPKQKTEVLWLESTFSVRLLFISHFSFLEIKHSDCS